MGDRTKVEVTQQFLHRYYRVSAEALSSVHQCSLTQNVESVENFVEKPVEN